MLVMRPVLGAAIGLSFLNLSVTKTCSIFSFFPRTGRDWNQLLPDMPDIASLVEFKNYLSSLERVNFIIVNFLFYFDCGM